MDEQEKLWLELALTPEVSARSVLQMIENLGDVEKIFSSNILELRRAGAGAGAAAGIAQRAGQDAAKREEELINRNSISLLTFNSGNYPPLLRRIPDPPPVLFALGQLSSEDAQAPVAIVGSRSATAYGAQVAHRLAGDLAARGVTIISGMARGIDQAAHNGALEAGGRTVAVLGSGLGKIYPTGSAKLVERISARGAVITEFPFETAANKITFPQRNRIISGVSYATLVVEASERSGALITARLALEQNRELLAVPGPLTSKQSIGTNYMIKRGAKLVQRADDVIEELPEEARERLKPIRDHADSPDLTKQEKQVLSLLSFDTPIHIDIIADRSGVGTADLSMILLSLEMKRLVLQQPGMEYLRKL